MGSRKTFFIPEAKGLCQYMHFIRIKKYVYNKPNLSQVVATKERKK